jgi:hypothetical protein
MFRVEKISSFGALELQPYVTLRCLWSISGDLIVQ